MTSQLIVQFLFAFFATCGLSIIFRVPVPRIPVCGLIGACGWLIYYIVTTYYGFSGVIACFCASCVVALLSDISSKVFKEAATVFIIPGIICLVPGAGMYRAMLALLSNDINGFTEEGTITLLAAGSIAVGLLVMGSLLRIIRMIFRRLRTAGKTM